MIRKTVTLFALGLAWLGTIPQVMATENSDWQISTSLAPEYDSNAHRELDGGQVVQDALLRASLGGDARWQIGKHLLSGQLALGGKAFAQQQSENTVVGLAELRYLWRFASNWNLHCSLMSRGRHLASALRDYSLVQANTGLSYKAWGPLRLQASLQPQLFFYPPDSRYNSQSISGFLSSQLAITKRENVALTYSLGNRQFPAAKALLDIDLQGLRQLSSDTRADVLQSFILQASSSRQVLVSASYSLSYNQSNSLGETYMRHRAQIVAAGPLPLDLFVQISAALQLTNYPGGLALSQQLLLADGDESQNKMVLSLRRPLAAGFALEWRLSLYSNELSASGLHFQRLTSQLGLRWGLSSQDL